ncbi:hypothetical protein CSUI_010969 [Cystoisospora suis]|uniref:Transmembrane protein n=1 Tax=Cystoisospora suis TaxID=483139 RepID=A0A2C6JV22_9APIC|nr:hypothetical protein CSUI_010969 [Cystoisospora suis]
MEDNQAEAGWSPALHGLGGQNDSHHSPTTTTSDSLASRLGVESRSQIFPSSLEDSRSRLLSPEAVVVVEEGEGDQKNDMRSKILDRNVPQEGRRSRRRRPFSYYPSSSSSSGRRHELFSSSRRSRPSLALCLMLASIVFLVVRHFILMCGKFLPKANLSSYQHQASLSTTFKEGHIPRLLAGGEDDKDQPNQTTTPQHALFASLTPSTVASFPACYGGEALLEGDMGAEEELRQEELPAEALLPQRVSSSEGSPGQSEERNPRQSTSSSDVESPIASSGSSGSPDIGEGGVSPQQADARLQRKRKWRTDAGNGSTSSSWE